MRAVLISGGLALVLALLGTPLFIRFLAAQRRPVLAFDADINQHLGAALGLPDGIAAKCEALGREYVLLVDAAVECSLQKAAEAMYLDPLCAMADDPEGLLRALIEENLDLLPEAWRHVY